METVDVAVIGMGPGGEEVAGACAEAGLSVLGIEKELVGGECPYWGCVPSKMAIRAADLIAETRRVDNVAGHATASPDWTPVAQRIRREATDNWDDTVAVDRFLDKGGHFLRGSGRIDGPGRVSVDGESVEVRRAIVVATGMVPVIPPIPGLSHVAYWTNREALKTERAPESIVVLGGGSIGLEMAQAYVRFGSRVMVIEGGPRVLAMEEPEAGDELIELLRDEGMEVHVGHHAASVGADEGGVHVELDDGTAVRGRHLLVATGRRVRMDGLGLESVGIDTSGHFIDVDDRLRAADGVWAVGDVTGHGAFTHIAMYQARIATADILGRDHAAADYTALPRVTFTDPEVGAVGVTEKQARERGVRVATGSTRVSTSARGWIHGPGNAGFIKLVADADRGVLVGATSMGPWGGEVLSLLALAVHARTPVETLRTMIYAYPTFHRGIEDALRDLG